MKWAGGKGKLAALVVARAPAGFAGYHEPFVGGGAVFFALRAAGYAGPAVLADANPDLVACYTAVRDDVEGVIAALAPLGKAYVAADAAARTELYYRIRSGGAATCAASAARLIFLNRTCYNGLYRVNAAGGFNVPHGRYANPRILDADGLRACAVALAEVEVRCEDFAAACERAAPHDFVYLDPPYQPLSRTASFTAYTAGDFGAGDQARLRDAFEALTRRGVAALLSNSDHAAVRDLYSGRGYGFDTVPMSRAINAVGSGRAPIAELLIDNFERVEALAAGARV